MLNTSLAIRYSRALYRISQAAGQARLICDELLAFCGVVDSSRDLKRVLYHPGITSAEKKAVVTELLTGNADPLTVRFISYIIGKKRIFHLTLIARKFASQLADDENRLNVKVESFSPLSDILQKRICDTLSSMMKKEITLVTEVKPSLMGGMRLTLGDRVIDGSISEQLKKLTRIVTAI
jgi:F-type H+-transporting ATPase subunit delta